MYPPNLDEASAECRSKLCCCSDQGKSRNSRSRASATGRCTASVAFSCCHVLVDIVSKHDDVTKEVVRYVLLH